MRRMLGGTASLPKVSAYTGAASLSEAVYQALLQGIMNGLLQPGERLVVEYLAQDLDVSPTPVKQALARLSGEGFVETRAGVCTWLGLTHKMFVTSTK